MKLLNRKTASKRELLRKIDELQEENNRLRSEYKPAMEAFRKSAEEALGAVVEESAHAQLGQQILENVVKQVAYKEVTAFEAKQWLEQKWHKRHDFEGTHEDQCEWLGLESESLEMAFKEIDRYTSQRTGDYAIKLFMDYFEAEKLRQQTSTEAA